MTDTAKPSCPELVALGRLQQLPGVPHDHLRHRVDPFDGDNAAPEGAPARRKAAAGKTVVCTHVTPSEIAALCTPNRSASSRWPPCGRSLSVEHIIRKIAKRRSRNSRFRSALWRRRR